MNILNYKYSYTWVFGKVVSVQYNTTVVSERTEALRPTGGNKGAENSDTERSVVLTFAYAGWPSPASFVALKDITYSVIGSK